MVMGAGRNPNIDDLIRLGQAANIDRTDIDSVIDQTRHALNKWPDLAKEFGIRSRTIKQVSQAIKDRTP